MTAPETFHFENDIPAATGRAMLDAQIEAGYRANSEFTRARLQGQLEEEFIDGDLALRSSKFKVDVSHERDKDGSLRPALKWNYIARLEVKSSQRPRFYNLGQVKVSGVELLDNPFGP